MSKHWVYIELKSFTPALLYISSTSLKFRSFTSLGYISKSSVGGENFSGSRRCLNDMGSVVSACSHLSEIAFTKYYGGIGS